MTEQVEAEYSAFAGSSDIEKIIPEDSKNTASLTVKLPQKRFFRQRAHANPFSDHLL